MLPVASQANWDLYRAAKAGFAALSEDAKTTPHPPVARGHPHRDSLFAFTDGFLYGGHLENLPGAPSLGGWEFWDGFLLDPLSPKAAQLQQAMRTVGLSVSGLNPPNQQA